MPKLAMGISYDGSAYNGWQYQDPPQVTIQKQLEIALSKIADQPIRTYCAGRTDKGVHGIGQVIHFDTTAIRSIRSWVLGTNSYLNADIRVMWATEVADNFHARFSAQARRYQYVIFNEWINSALLHDRVTIYFPLLNENLMHEAAQYLVGEHDFSSYRANECQAKSPIRTVEYLKVTRSHSFVIIDIKANAFLHHMVRNIAGVLLAVGSGKQPPIWAKQVLDARNRKEGDITAPPSGLYFSQVFYPEEFKLPEPTAKLFFLT